jgi:hypothetical protein
VDGPPMHCATVRNGLDVKTFRELLVLRLPVKSVVRKMYGHA